MARKLAGMAAKSSKAAPSEQPVGIEQDYNAEDPNHGNGGGR
jgi:hypothetical protein